MKRPTITRTAQQALIRARGLYGKRAWVESLPQARIDAKARAALLEWLESLTTTLRMLDVMLDALVEFDRSGVAQSQIPALVKSVRAQAVAPFGALVMAYRVGEVERLAGVPFRTIRGSGWSWDEAFEMAERQLEEKEGAT